MADAVLRGGTEAKAAVAGWLAGLAARNDGRDFSCTPARRRRRPKPVTQPDGAGPHPQTAQQQTAPQQPAAGGAGRQQPHGTQVAKTRATSTQPGAAVQPTKFRRQSESGPPPQPPVIASSTSRTSPSAKRKRKATDEEQVPAPSADGPSRQRTSSTGSARERGPAPRRGPHHVVRTGSGPHPRPADHQHQHKRAATLPAASFDSLTASGTGTGTAALPRSLSFSAFASPLSAERQAGVWSELYAAAYHGDQSSPVQFASPELPAEVPIPRSGSWSGGQVGPAHHQRLYPHQLPPLYYYPQHDRQFPMPQPSHHQRPQQAGVLQYPTSTGVGTPYHAARPSMQQHVQVSRDLPSLSAPMSHTAGLNNGGEVPPTSSAPTSPLRGRATSPTAAYSASSSPSPSSSSSSSSPVPPYSLYPSRGRDEDDWDAFLHILRGKTMSGVLPPARAGGQPPRLLPRPLSGDPSAFISPHIPPAQLGQLQQQQHQPPPMAGGAFGMAYGIDQDMEEILRTVLTPSTG